jgi:hypothetical protein
MTTLILKRAFVKNQKDESVPVTGRGRALYTVDWFLNGKPVLRNHDNPNLQLNQGYVC